MTPEDPTPTQPLVLIADNDPGVSTILQAAFSRLGVGVQLAGDGQEALERLQAGGVAALICDLDMPRLSGEELLQVLVDASFPVPPVLVISGYVDAGLQGRLAALPIVHSIHRKPFDVVGFARQVAALVAPARPGMEAADRPAGGGA